MGKPKLVNVETVLQMAVHAENFKYQAADLVDLKNLLDAVPAYEDEQKQDEENDKG